MAPTHELLHGLTEVTKYLRDDPRRLALAERAGTSEVSHKLFMRLYCARHPSRMAHCCAEMQDSCPLSGRNLAFMRLVRHVTGLRPPQPPAALAPLHEPGGRQPAQATHDRVEIHPGGDRDPRRPAPGPGRDGLQDPGVHRAEQVPRKHGAALSLGGLIAAELQQL